jgi:signal transduction histidine kinase
MESGTQGRLVHADPERLEEALTEIATNACEAVGAGGTLRLASLRSDGVHDRCSNFLALVVADDGPGMSPDVCRRATETFFTTHPPQGGRGLGLSLASGFARQSGGRLVIDSAPGAGTEVRLLLPMA